MLKLVPHISIFIIWLIVLTFALGFLGMILPQAFSMLILLPYMISFYIMTRHFLKKHQQVPDLMQRWQLSIGCATSFWLYSIVAGLIGIFLLQEGFDLSGLLHAMNSLAFVLVFSAIFLCLNATLVFLGFLFLGKPASKMLDHIKSNQNKTSIR